MNLKQVWSHELFLHRLWSRSRLRRRLTIGVWLSIVPFTLAGSGLALWHAHDIAIKEWERRALKDAELIDSAADSWDTDILRLLGVLAKEKSVRMLEQPELVENLRQAKRSWPDYEFAIFTPDGQSLATTVARSKYRQGFTLEAKEVRSQEWFQAANAGISGSWLTPNSGTKSPFYFGSVPIYRQQISHRARPIAILAGQIKLSSIDKSSGLHYLFASTENAQRASNQLISFDLGRQSGMAALIVLRPGGVHLIGQKELSDKYRNDMLNPSYALKSRWRPVIELALQPGPENQVTSLTINRTGYLLAVKRHDDNRSVVLIADKQNVLHNVNLLFLSFWLVSLAALALSSVSIYRICTEISKPIDQAGDALAAIGKGEFDARLPSIEGDIGRLYDSINRASDQLRQYFLAATRHAVTEAQLADARRIQNDFLVKDIPIRPEVSLAASFQPAYEIGADWYDAILSKDKLFIVVADVCDKGIPSALYMSVFRSLLRNSILSLDADIDDSAEVLGKSLSAVNRYMALNHAGSAMFATVFVGVYEIDKMCLGYIVAGHEPPLVLCGSRIEELEICGGAVGIFPDATYTPRTLDMSPGSLLLAYSDGLPDTRDQAGKPFGKERIKNILLERSSGDWSATSLIDQLRRSAVEHQDGAEQFDDLTLMVVKTDANNIPGNI